MAQINFNKLHLVNDDAGFEAAIASLHKRGESIQLDIHKLLVAIGTRWHKTGDVRPVVVHVNMLLNKMPAGVRSNAIRAWVETFFGLVFAEEGEFKGQFVAGKATHKKLDLPAMTNNRWWEFKPETAYKPINFDAMWDSLMKKAEKASADKGDKVDMALVRHLQKARAEYMQSLHPANA